MSKHWVKWDEYSTPQDIVESVMEVINDITREHNFQVDHKNHLEIYKNRYLSF